MLFLQETNGYLTPMSQKSVIIRQLVAVQLSPGHIGEGHLIIKKIKIGNNCLIGGDCFIMPGAIIEDNVVLGAKSLVLKDQILQKGKFYAGIPAQEIKTIEQVN